MTPAQCFGVVVRTFGLLMTIYGTVAGCFGLVATLGNDPGAVAVILAGAVLLLAFGLWFLRGAKLLVAFAYPEERGPGHFYQLAADQPSGVAPPTSDRTGGPPESRD